MEAATSSSYNQETYRATPLQLTSQLGWFQPSDSYPRSQPVGRLIRKAGGYCKSRAVLKKKQLLQSLAEVRNGEVCMASHKYGVSRAMS